MGDCKTRITLRVSATVFGFFQGGRCSRKQAAQGSDICSSSVNVCWMNTWKQKSRQGGALTVLWELTVGWGCGQRKLAGGPRASWSSGSACVQGTMAVVGTSGGARAGWEERRSRGTSWGCPLCRLLGKGLIHGRSGARPHPPLPWWWGTPGRLHWSSVSSTRSGVDAEGQLANLG